MHQELVIDEGDVLVVKLRDMPAEFHLRVGRINGLQVETTGTLLMLSGSGRQVTLVEVPDAWADGDKSIGMLGLRHAGHRPYERRSNDGA